MNALNQLSFKGQTKLLKKTIVKNLVAQGITISSRNSEREFRFWLQKIIQSSKSEGSSLSEIGTQLARQIIEVCQRQQTLNLDKTIIHLIGFPRGNLLEPNGASSITAASNSSTNLGQQAQENNRYLDTGGQTSPLATVGTQTTSVAPATETIQPPESLATESQALPDFLELFNGNVESTFERNWVQFQSLVGCESSVRLPNEEILGTTDAQELIFIASGSRGLAIANPSHQELDFAVAKMPALDVGRYRELQYGFTIAVDYGDDGNKYISQWGKENRGGIQIGSQTILLFVRE